MFVKMVREFFNLTFVLYFFVGILYAENENLTWIKSVSKCQLASKKEVESIKTPFAPSWIGGYYVTSPWISYEGCFTFSESAIQNRTNHKVDKLPVDCLDICGNSSFFAIMQQKCVCLDKKDDLEEASHSNCNVTCLSHFSCTFGIADGHLSLFSMNQQIQYGDVSLAPSYGVYISQLVRFADICSDVDDFNERNLTITCKLVQQDAVVKNSENQRWMCLSVKKRPTKAYLKATNCERKKHVLCRHEHTFKEMNLKYDYDQASKQCDISKPDDIYNWTANRTDLEYWTNVRRFSRLKFVNNSTDNDTIDEVQISKCLSAERKANSTMVNTVRLSCDNKLPYICSPEDNVLTTVPGTVDDFTSSVLDDLTTTSKELDSTLPLKSTNNITNRTGEVFTLQCVFIGCLSIAVLFAAFLSCYVYGRQSKSASYDFESPSQHAKENQEIIYADPVDTLGTENVYEHPWDIQPFKVTRVFSSLRRSVFRGASALQNTFFHRISDVPPTVQVDGLEYMSTQITGSRLVLYDSPTQHQDTEC